MKNANKNNQSNQLKHVALLLESDMAFDRAVARGVGDYIRSQAGWVIQMDPMTKPSIHRCPLQFGMFYRLNRRARTLSLSFRKPT